MCVTWTDFASPNDGPKPACKHVVARSQMCAGERCPGQRSKLATGAFVLYERHVLFMNIRRLLSGKLGLVRYVGLAVMLVMLPGIGTPALSGVYGSGELRGGGGLTPAAD